MTRTMTNHLREALDGLSGPERRAVLRVAEQSDGATPMSRILRAVATELRVRQLEEDGLLRALEADRQADLDALHAGWPMPTPDGAIRLTFNPETGEFRPDSGPGEGVTP